MPFSFSGFVAGQFDLSIAANAGFGKLKEPLLRLTNLLRSFNASAQNGRYLGSGTGTNVTATENTFGDILTDLGAILSGVNWAGQPPRKSGFEISLEAMKLDSLHMNSSSVTSSLLQKITFK